MKKMLWYCTLLLLVNNAMAQRSRLAPDFVVAQYAGSIGYMSVGTGYDVFKQKGRISGHFGNVPANKGGSLDILAAKIIYEPKVFTLSEKVSVNPLDVGVMFSYHFGDNFKSNVPDYLSTDNYYWWHTSLRVHLITETSVTLNFDQHTFLKAVTGYLELNSNDLYLVSFINNTHSLKFHELVKAGAGIRLTF